MKNVFTRKEVIAILDLLKESNYHNQGFNGWSKYGHSVYIGFSSENVLNDIEQLVKTPISYRVDNNKTDMNTLSYRGFIGTFNYAEEDGILFGKIEGVTDLVTFQGASIQEVKKAFTEAVEDYIILCAEVGKEPMKSGNTNLERDK